MTNIQTLIDQTLSNAWEAKTAGNADLSKSYAYDWNQFIDIKWMIESGYTSAAATALNEMDTAPLEQFVMAMEADGIDIEKYGFELH